MTAASCANEAFKLATNCASAVNNYMMYVGGDGVYTYTFELQRKEDCQVCGSGSLKMTMQRSDKLQDLMDALLDKQEVQLKKPSLRSATTSLYMQAPKALEMATRPNLEKPLVGLFPLTPFSYFFVCRI
jgi:ubiquitin-activating enzyme E1 C